ncbi:hypothetical protein CYMTET_17765, partial [Cymbomonas tetramitiformis]
VTFAPGETIIQQGMPGRNVYIVVDGNPVFFEKDSIKREVKLEGELKPGDTFGEVALLYACPHSATVTAPPGAKVTTWALNQKVFHTLMRTDAFEKRKLLADALTQVHPFAQLR